MSEPSPSEGWRKHDGHEFPGDPNAEVDLIYRNGQSPREQPIKASSRRWEWRRTGPDAWDVVWWRVA